MQLKRKEKGRNKGRERKKESGKDRSSKDKLKPTKERGNPAEERRNRTCKVPKYPTSPPSKVSTRFK